MQNDAPARLTAKFSEALSVDSLRPGSMVGVATP